MSEQALVIISDPDDAKHAEINFAESVPKAAKLVETLLEAGFDQARIRVFVGGEIGMHVRQRPVVTFVDGTESPEPVIESDGVSPTVNAAIDSPKQELAAELYAKNGVRFSAAFRPA